MINSFVDTIKSLARISDDEIEELLHIPKQKTIKKGSCFIYAGDVPQQFGFNLKGLFRYFYTNQYGNDYTKGFISENNFVISYSAMVLNRESYFSIEAMEDSDLLVFSYEQWENLTGKNIVWDSLIKALLEKVYIMKEKREKELLLDNAETRYKAFLKEYPNIEARVKQYHIASYLGITPIALSRIRKNMDL